MMKVTKLFSFCDAQPRENDETIFRENIFIVVGLSTHATEVVLDSRNPESTIMPHALEIFGGATPRMLSCHQLPSYLIPHNTSRRSMAPTVPSETTMMMRRAAVVVGLASLLAGVAATAGAVTFRATNAASSTAGGKRFGRDIGVAYSRRVLSDASSFCWKAFNQPSPGPGSRKPVSSVTLVVEDIGGVAFTSGNGIHLSAQYVGGYSGDVKTEV